MTSCTTGDWFHHCLTGTTTATTTATTIRQRRSPHELLGQALLASATTATTERQSLTGLLGQVLLASTTAATATSVTTATTGPTPAITAAFAVRHLRGRMAWCWWCRCPSSRPLILLLLALGVVQLCALLLHVGGYGRSLRDAVASAFAGAGSDYNYSRRVDVYANLSRLLLAPRDGPLPLCPERSPLLVGPIDIDFERHQQLSEIARHNPLVRAGGVYSPPDCHARHSTAVVVPHRNREHHLRHLLYYLHPVLQRQQLHYTIYVVHQAGNETFNRAKLMNVGFREAMADDEWSCVFYHDVDLVPENDHNIYTCDSNPKHMSAAMDKFMYRLPYLRYFGGVSALSPEHYLKMNGFPNTYWGWGGEDDDIAHRVTLAKMKIVRPPMSVARYKMVKHRGDQGNEENPHRFTLLAHTRRMWNVDGMNTLSYRLLSRVRSPLYTNITVDIGKEKR